MMQGTDQNGKKRCAVVTPNWEKPKEQEEGSNFYVKILWYHGRVHI